MYVMMRRTFRQYQPIYLHPVALLLAFWLVEKVKSRRDSIFPFQLYIIGYYLAIKSLHV